MAMASIRDNLTRSAPLLLGLALLAALVVTFTEASDADTMRNQPARIVRLRGRVAVLTPGSTTWRMAHERETIHPGTRVATESGATVLIELSRRNTLQLGEVTEIALDTSVIVTTTSAAGGLGGRTTEQRIQVSQTSGRMLSSIRNLSQYSSFDLVTPSGSVRTRGGAFLTVINDEGGGSATFVVTDGKLTILDPDLGNPNVLDKGQQIRIGDGSGGSGVNPVDRTVLDQIRQNDVEPMLDGNKFPIHCP